MSRAVVYKGNLKQLEMESVSGNGESAALAQLLVAAGHPSRWKSGDRVVDLSYLPPGTVIANFKVIKQSPRGPGFAGAIFKGFGPRLTRTKQAGSIVIMDQQIRGKFKPRTVYNHGPNTASGPDNAYDWVVVNV